MPEDFIRCRNIKCRNVYSPVVHSVCPRCEWAAGSDDRCYEWVQPSDPDYPQKEASVGAMNIPDKFQEDVDVGNQVDRELATKEYFQCLSIIDAFDGRVLSIKAWSVTTSLAGIGAAFSYSKPNLLLVSAVSSLVFWWLEGTWKMFQHMYINRSKEIESYLRNEGDAAFRTPLMRPAEMKQWANAGSIRESFMSHGHVMLPHVVVAGAGIILWLLDQFGAKVM